MLVPVVFIRALISPVIDSLKLELDRMLDCGITVGKVSLAEI